MSTITLREHRARIAADAVISAYINELGSPPRVAPATPAPRAAGAARAHAGHRRHALAGGIDRVRHTARRGVQHNAR